MLQFHGQSLFGLKTPSNNKKISQTNRKQDHHMCNPRISQPGTPPSSPQAEGHYGSSENEWTTEMQELDIDNIHPRVFTPRPSYAIKIVHTDLDEDYIWSALEEEEDLDYIPGYHHNGSHDTESDVSEGYTSEDSDNFNLLSAIFLEEENLTMLRAATEEFCLPSWIGQVPKTVGSKTGG
ncbi:hypothetical protein DFH28DRAFT_826965, partial [Melampsora americana]